MRQFLVLILFLAVNFAAAPHLRADSSDPSDLFLNAYMSVQKAQKLEEDGKFKLALQTYKYAATLLQQIHAKSPDWQPVIVSYRLSKTSEAIALLEKKISVDGPGSMEVEPPLPQNPDENPAGTPPPLPRVDTGNTPTVPSTGNPFTDLQNQYTQMQSELARMKASYAAKEHENEQLKEKLDGIIKERDQARVDVSQLKAQIKQAEDAYETAMADKTKDSAGVKELKDQVARLENALKERDAELAVAQDASEEEKLRVTNARLQRDAAIKERDDAMDSLKKAREGQQQVDKLMADNAALAQKLSDAQKTIADLNASAPAKDAQIASLQKDLNAATEQLAAARKQSQENLDAMNALQQQVEAATTQLSDIRAAGGGTSDDTKRLTEENELLRGIVLGVRKEEAHRDQERQLALAELSKLHVQSGALEKQINNLGQPVLMLTDKERALFKKPDVSISDNGIHVAAERPVAPDASPSPAPPMPAATATPAPQPAATPEPAATPVPSVSASPSPTAPAATPSPAMTPAPDTTPIAATPAPEKPAPDSTPKVQTSVTPPVSAELVPQANQAKENFERGQYRDAEKIYLALVEQEPKNIYLLDNLGVVRFRSGKLKPAEETFRKALAVAPDDEFSHRTLGIVYYTEGKLDEAVGELTKALAINPKDAIAHNYLGITASAKGWQEAARKELETAVAIDPNYQDAHFNLAVIYLTTPPVDKDNAKKHYKRALELGAEPDPAFEQLLNK